MSEETWRPDGWKNPYPKTGETLGMFALYEAGANAMLEALWKLAGESPTGTFTLDSHTITIYSEGRGEDLIEDGFGCAAPAVCPVCHCRAVYVNRPGDIRCGACDGNPEEYYTGEKCDNCGRNAIHNGECLCCEEN